MKVDPPPSSTGWASACCRWRAPFWRTSDFPSLVQPQLDDCRGATASPRSASSCPTSTHDRGRAGARQAPVRLHVDVGSRFPALISATGRCLAAFSEHAGRDREALSRAALAQRTDYEAWRKEVETVRRQGFSIDRGNYIAGVTIVAVPVWGRARSPNARGGRPRRASSIVRPRSRWRTTCGSPTRPKPRQNSVLTTSWIFRTASVSSHAHERARRSRSGRA